MKRRTTFEKLMDAVRALGYDIPDVHCHRLRPGYWGRAASAWSWVAEDNTGRERVGSCDPVWRLWADGFDVTPSQTPGVIELHLRYVYAT